MWTAMGEGALGECVELRENGGRETGLVGWCMF